jgi:integrase/recombinase XerD
LDFISLFYIPCGANRGANLNIMKQLKASATLLFDNRHEKSDGTYSVKLTIYYAGVKKRYSTNIEMTLTQWQKINSDKLRDDDLKILKRKLAIQVTKAEKIIEVLEPFSFDDFEKIFFEKSATKSGFNLEQLFNNYFDELIKDGRIGNAFANRTTKNSLLSFKPSLSLLDITPDFLKNYENFMRQKNASPSTIGIYLRHLRAMINKAIGDGLLDRDKYPFKKYKIPSSRNIKKALSFDELKQVLAYKSKNGDLQKAADFWILTYLCNGMNMTDILLLKHKR